MSFMAEMAVEVALYSIMRNLWQGVYVSTIVHKTMGRYCEHLRLAKNPAIMGGTYCIALQQTGAAMLTIPCFNGIHDLHCL